MEFQELRYFLAVSETLHFSRAAELCNVSQPALTRAIRSLEQKLGAGDLIHRERGNTHLTELGLIMRPYFEASLASLEAARSAARAHSTLGVGTLKLGLMSTIGPVRLIGLLAGFATEYPQVDIRLEDGDVDTIEEHLAAGQLDIAIYCRAGPLADRFHSVELFRERFVVALPPNDPLAQRQGVGMRELDGRRYLGRSHCEYYQHLRDIRLRLGGIEFERPYSSNRDDWVQSMVVAGLGFTYLPEYAVTMPELVLRPLVEPEVWRTLQLVTVRGRPHSPAVGAFVRAARKFAWAGKIDVESSDLDGAGSDDA